MQFRQVIDLLLQSLSTEAFTFESGCQIVELLLASLKLIDLIVGIKLDIHICILYYISTYLKSIDSLFKLLDLRFALGQFSEQGLEHNVVLAGARLTLARSVFM